MAGFGPHPYEALEARARGIHEGKLCAVCGHPSHPRSHAGINSGCPQCRVCNPPRRVSVHLALGEVRYSRVNAADARAPNVYPPDFAETGFEHACRDIVALEPGCRVEIEVQPPSKEIGEGEGPWERVPMDTFLAGAKERHAELVQAKEREGAEARGDVVDGEVVGIESTPMNTILVGNRHEPEPVDATVRTSEQRATVENICESEDFDFACGNPFVPEVGKYIGPFHFLYYTKDGKLHSQGIAPDGSVLRHIIT